MSSIDEVERQNRFAKVFEDCYGPLLAYTTRRSNSAADAQDIVSLSFQVLWQKFDTLPIEMDPLPWLYGVARRCLANHRRRLMTQDRYREELRHQATLLAQPLQDENIDDQNGRIVRHALSLLESPDQEILRLSAWEEMSHAQIGLVMNISENAVSIRIHRARKRLGEKLRKELSSKEA